MPSLLRESRRGLTVRALLAALALLAVAPSGAQAFSKMIWGDVYRHGVNQFPLYRQLGVKVFQADLNWPAIAPVRPADPANPADPAYQWPATIDQAIAQARRFHMRVMLQLFGSPAWANGGHQPDWRSWAPNPGDFATFALAAARRYPGVHLWMVWGEPNRFSLFMPEQPADPAATTLTPEQQQAPRNYARILDAAYGTLKQASRRNQVLGGSTYALGAITTWQWIKYMRLPNGRAPRMDMYAHNPFTMQDPSTFSGPPSPSGESQFVDLRRLAAYIDRHLRRGLPLFLSEWTIPTAPDQEFSFWVDPPVAARWIRDALRLSRRWHRIYGLGWIHVYDDPRPPQSNPPSAGGLIYANGRKKPGFWAFAHG